MKIHSKFHFFAFLLLILLGMIACNKAKNHTTDGNHSTDPKRISDDSLLTLVEKQTFEYFWKGAGPHSGMARERININGVYPHSGKTS